MVNVLIFHSILKIIFEDYVKNNFIVMCTKNGVVKKTNLIDYKNFRRGGIIGINILCKTEETTSSIYVAMDYIKIDVQI